MPVSLDGLDSYSTTLLRTARSDEASTSKALTAPRQFLGSGSTDGGVVL